MSQQPYRLISVNDTTVLEENPETAYGKAHLEGNLAYALVSLQDVREKDWFVWMVDKLCEADESLDPLTVTAAAALACIRRPVEPDMVHYWAEDWLAKLRSHPRTLHLWTRYQIGTEEGYFGDPVSDSLESVLNRLLKDGNVQTKDGPIEAVRNIDGKLQFISTSKWPIPELEVE